MSIGYVCLESFSSDTLQDALYWRTVFYTLFRTVCKTARRPIPCLVSYRDKGGGIVNSLQVGTQFPKQVGLQALPFSGVGSEASRAYIVFLRRSTKEELA